MLYKQKDSLNASEQETLLKYAIRSSTRCTLYGIFSGVDFGTFEKQTEIIVNMEKNQTRTRVDTGWLCAMIKNLEGQDEIVWNLSVIFNKQCVIKGERIFNPYLNELGSREQRREGGEVSLRYTEILKRIRQISDTWIPVRKIIELLKKERPDVGENRKIQGDLLVKLKTIDKLIEKYDRKPLGNGISIYHRICNLMKDLKESSDYLQIDMQINCVKNQLSYEIREECERAADFFAYMSVAICDTEELNLYKAGFLEKYGYHIYERLLWYG